MSDHWTGRLSEYLDGDVTESERAQLEGHIAACSDCRAVLEQLEVVKRRAETLEDRPPQSELWPGIAERIREIPRDGSVVIGLGERRPGHGRQFTFTVPQLIAAGIALMVVSAAGVWLAHSAVSRGYSVPAAAETQPFVGSAVLAGFDVVQYDAAVAELEQVLSEARERLDPATARVLEQSLATIDEAIADAYGALRTDPADGYLTAHLTAVMRRKITVLQRAAALANAAS